MTRWARSFCKVDVFGVRGLNGLKYQCMDVVGTVARRILSKSSDAAYIQVRGIWRDPNCDVALLNVHKKLLPSHSFWDFYIKIHFAERLIPLIDRAFIVDVRVPFRRG